MQLLCLRIAEQNRTEQNFYLQFALFCCSPLRNDNIHIHDMHKHKALLSALPMQRFISHNAFCETVQDKLCRATKL